MGGRLAKQARRKDELDYEFSILNDSTPNAWALPGGKIVVNRGLLLELESEAELAAVEMALYRLISEQRKAQKRVNALRYNIIPRYQATIRYIESVLEEEERNTLFQIKVLRENERRRDAGG